MNPLFLVFVWWSNQNSFVYDPGRIISVAGGRKFWATDHYAVATVDETAEMDLKGEDQPEGINRI